jgi:circadian clock protein KaiC
MSDVGSEPPRVNTGIPGIDAILAGGLRRESATLVRGPPGSGKTIFGLHFLAAGHAAGETGLYVNLGEPAAYIRETADSFGLDIESVEFLTLSPSSEKFQTETTYDVFSSAEVEGPSLVESIREETTELDPDRVVVDPATEFRYLTPDEHQFRTQILSLLDFLKAADATVVLTSQAADSMPDDDLQFLVDAVVSIDDESDRRTIQVPKFRGSAVRRGRHTLAITSDGMEVWPKLDPGEHGASKSFDTLSSGIPDLDTLLSGGLTHGTVTFLSGPTGVGKTTVGLQFIKRAAAAGRRSVLYSFEEDRDVLLDRAEAVDIPVTDMIDEESLRVIEIDPGEFTADEFTAHVRREVEERGTELVMLDGTTGFRRSVSGLGDDAMAPVVRLGRYLRKMNVTGIITNEVHQITGSFRATEQNISHLADTIVILRHVEYKGELRKVLGVLKKRTSDYEPRLRELEITADGLAVGDPLTELRGILTGTPEWNDDTA